MNRYSRKPGLCESTSDFACLCFKLCAALTLLGCVGYVVVLALHFAAALVSGVYR